MPFLFFYPPALEALPRAGACARRGCARSSRLNPAVFSITPSDGVKSDAPLVVVLRRVEVLDAVLRYVAGVRIAGTIQWDHDEVSESFEGVSSEYLGE